LIFPEDMIRVSIIGLREKIDEIITKVLKFGYFHPDEPKTPISNNRMEEARRELTTVTDYINVVRKLMEEAGISLEPSGKMRLEGSWFDTAKKIYEESEKIKEEYKALLLEIKQLEEEKSKLEETLNVLEAYKEIEESLETLYNLQYFDVYMGILNEDQLRKLSKIDNIVLESKKLTSGNKKEELYAVLIITPKGELEKIIKDLKLKRLEIENKDSPKNMYKEIKDKMENIQKTLEKEREILANKLADKEKEVKEVYGKLLTLRDAFNLMTRARVSEYFVQLEGYVPYKFYKKFGKSLEGEGVVVSYSWPKKYEEAPPPTYVTNPSVVRPLQSIIELYGTPSYWDISPEVFLTFTFPIIFGLMFPDVGNALLLLGFALWFYFYYGKRRGSESNKNLGIVLIYSSIGAIITGLIAGEFFGGLMVGGLRELLNNNEAPVGPLHDIWPFPESVRELLSPIIPFGGQQSIINSMILVALLGAISLFGSSLLGLINVIRKRDYEVVILEKIPILIIYTSPFILFVYGFFTKDYFNTEIALLGAIKDVIFSPTTINFSNQVYLIAALTVYLAIFGLLYNFVGKVVLLRKHENVSSGMAIGVGFIEGAFESAILLLSNTISFIRILVFALAHYYVLYAFSYLAFIAAGSSLSLVAIATNPASIVMLIIGNLIATALEGLVVFIQTTRLHFYEMFSKFYEGRGKKFEPVKTYILLQ